MTVPHPASRPCTGCGRIVFVSDADASGRCVFCQPKLTKRTKTAQAE